MQEHLRKITDRRTKATLEIKAFDTTVLTGVKPTGVLLDELHEIAKVAAAERIDESGKLGSVGLDPFGVGAIVDALAEVGIAGNDRVVGITQGWKLTGAIKTAERKLADGTFSHGGLGLMAWAVSNASRCFRWWRRGGAPRVVRAPMCPARAMLL